MSESELIRILNSHYSSSFKNSFSVYLISAGVSFVATLVAVFFSSYFKKSGELAAIEAKFEETQNQLKKQTLSIEEIRADISNRIWIEQKKWEFRKDIYLNLIDLLLKIQNECSKAEVYLNEIQKNCFIEDDTDFEKMKENSISKAEKIYFNEVAELTNELKIVLSKTGLLFLDSEVINSINEYFETDEIRIQLVENRFTQDYKHEIVTLDDSTSIHNYEESLYYKLKAAKNAYNILIKFARNDLKING